jgi:hypothetical protein
LVDVAGLASQEDQVARAEGCGDRRIEADPPWYRLRLAAANAGAAVRHRHEDDDTAMRDVTCRLSQRQAETASSTQWR